MTTSTVDLLAAISTHLAEFELPASASVCVADAVSTPQVTVQLTCGTPPAIAQGLLAWADTLTEVSAEAWRVPEGDSVHLVVTGLLSDGATIRAYGWMRVTDRSWSADLAPNATKKLPLATLRHLATPGQATDEVTL